MAENMVRIAKQPYDDQAAIKAASFLVDTIEGKAAQKTELSVEAKVALITANMTPAEASRLYQAEVLEKSRE
jgi:hypothetical protein